MADETLPPDPPVKPVRIIAGGAPVSATRIVPPTLGPPFGPEHEGGPDIPSPSRIGKYEIISEIARGGMGVVFRARQTDLSRTVALKMILSGPLASDAALERFRLEATAAAQLDHPNIVPIYEVGEEDGQHFFSMRLVEGGSLADHLARYMEDPRAAAELIAKVARAVHHAHQHGILHRDLKPANILLDAAHEPQVSDFGLAKWEQADTNLTQPESCLGTPSFMAPEQAKGSKTISTAADIYSLGGILYQTLTGLPPFMGNNVVEVLRRVVDEPPPAPRSIRPRVPVDLEIICLKCLAKEPKHRYPSAEALADDLSRYVRGEPIEARPVSTTERTWRWCRRKPAQATAIGAVLLAIVAVLIVQSVAVYKISRSYAREQRSFASRLVSDGNRELASGDAAQGLHLLASSLDKASSSGFSDLEQSIRQQIGVWQNFMHPLTCIVDHGGEVLAMDISGRVLVTAGVDQVRVWDVLTGNAIGAPIQHGAPVRAVAIDPTGTRIVTGGDDGKVTLWDIATGKPLTSPMIHHAPVLAVAFSPDGKTLATASEDKQAMLWNAATGTQLQTLPHNAAVRSVSFDKSGNLLLTTSDDGMVRTWNVTTGKIENSYTAADEQPRTARMMQDGQVVSVSAHSQHLDAMLKKLDQHEVTVPEGTAAVAISNRGLLLAGGDDSVARLWDLQSGTMLGPPIHHPARITSATLSADGSSFVTGCVDGSVRIWHVATGQSPQSPLRAEGSVQAITVSSINKQLISGDDSGSVILWDLSTGKPTISVKQDGPVMSIASAQNGEMLLSGGQNGLVQRWNARNADAIHPSLLHGENAWVNVIAVNAQGDRAITGGNDGIVRLWNLSSGEAIGEPMKHSEAITAASFRPDGKVILTASRDATAQHWDATTAKPIASAMHHDDTVWSAAFSPMGDYLVTSSRDHSVRLWDAQTGASIGSPLVHEDEVLFTAFSSDGKMLATACSNGSVNLWDVSASPQSPPRKLHTIKHGSAVVAIAFSPDSHLLLVGCTDNHARLWDTSSAEAVGPVLEHSAALTAVAFDRSGKLAITASADGSLKLWPISPASGSAQHVSTWSETITGITQDGSGTFRWMTAAEWKTRHNNAH